MISTGKENSQTRKRDYNCKLICNIKIPLALY